MSLLSEIQDAAMDPGSSLADLLRKCLTLSYRLKHDAFRQWVEGELNGYPDKDEVPAYRQAQGDIYANVAGPFQSMQNNVPVPRSQLPADSLEALRSMNFHQGAAELEQLAASAKAGSDRGLMRYLPMELCARVEIYEGWSTVRMWSHVPTSKLGGVLDQIRTRALQFALEIEAVNPTAGESSGTAAPPVPGKVVSQIFNTVILGGAVTMAAGNQTAHQSAVQVTAGDTDALRHVLRDQGIDEADSAGLLSILASEPVADGRTPGPKAHAWIRKAATKAAAGGGRVAEAAVTAVLSAAVKSYLGLP